MRIEIRLQPEGFDGLRVELDTTVVFSDVVSAGVSAGEVGFKSWGEEIEVFGEF